MNTKISNFRSSFSMGVMLLAFVSHPLRSMAATEAQLSVHDQVRQARVFREALAWIGEQPPPEVESQKLLQALRLSRAESADAALGELESFLTVHTNSAWAPSLRAVLAKYYREHGRYTPALEHWQAAWNATKEAKGGSAKQIADFTLAHWTRLLATLGRADVLKALFQETQGRVLDGGPLQQMYLSTGEALYTMLATPGRSYRCGTFALNSVARALKLTNDVRELLELQSPTNGFALSELVRISQRLGLGLIPVRRLKAEELVVPSVVHWKQSHYAAITERSGDLYHVLDPTFGAAQWLAAAAINAEASGVFMVPENAVPAGWHLMSIGETDTIFGKGVGNGMADDDDSCDGSSSGGGGSSSEGKKKLPPIGSTTNFAPERPGCKGCGTGGGGGNGGGGGCPSCGGEGGEEGTEGEGEGPIITGMPRWRVSEPYINLWVEDEPLGYQPARGRRTSFRIGYKQRDQVLRNTNWFSLGVLWNCSWLSHIEGVETQTNITMYARGGGKRQYTANGSTVEYNSNTRMDWVEEPFNDLFELRFRVLYPNGALDMYGFFVEVAANQTNAFLTEQVSSLGHTNRFEYTNYGNGVVRLLRVIDAQSQTNLVYYATNHAYSSNLIARVVDPFGRETKLEYDSTGHLTNVTDVAGLSSSFKYDGSGWMTNMITPYGTTVFRLTGTTNYWPEPIGEIINRSALITEPNGTSKQLYLYRDNGWSILPGTWSDYPQDLPAGAPYVDYGLATYRNSFYWNRQQFAALPESARTNISNLASNDYKIARLRHWYHQRGHSNPNYVGRTLGMERAASPTLSPLVEGQKTWYGYPGITWVYEGDSMQEALIAQVPNNDTNQPTRFIWNQFDTSRYIPTNIVTSYSLTDGAAALRTNSFIYAANKVDILKVIGPNGETEGQSEFDGAHRVVGETNAVGYWTRYAYNNNGQLTNVTRSSGLTTTRRYDGSGYLTNRNDVEIGRSDSFTYQNGLVQTHTDALGLKTTNIWDNLQRLTCVSDANGYVSNIYTKLDLTATRDKLGNWRYFTYNALRQLTSQTNELGRATTYSYCECGSLESITDALSNATSYDYDLNGRLIRVGYPGGSSTTNNFNVLGQLLSVHNSGGSRTTNWYNNQGLIVAVSNAFGRVSATIYDKEDRKTNTVDASGITVVSTFDDLGRVLSRTYPDTGVEKFQYSARGLIGYTNQLGKVTKHTYDEAGRKIGETNANNEVVQFKYDASGNLTNLIDGKSQKTFWKYDSLGRITNKVDHNGSDMFRYAYDANNRLTNRWTPAKTNTYYAYDAVGNLTNVDYALSTDIRLQYDALNRLTNMVDAVGTTRFTHAAFGALLSEDGPWENDTVTYGYDNGRRRSSLTLLQPNASALAQSYGYDAANRLTNVTSPAGTFGYTHKSAGMLIQKLTLAPSAYITNDFDGMGQLLSTHLRNSGNTLLNKHEYIYNVVHQRTRQTRFNGDYIDYTYDDIGQLLTGTAKESGGTPNRWQEQFTYAYDPAGNLTNRIQNKLTNAFTVNALNQLTGGSRGGRFTVAGTTTSPATNVTVNTSNSVLYLDYTFASTNHSLSDGTNTFTAIGKDNLGRIDTNIATLYLPASPNFFYDSNGNLTYDGHKALEYDDENQLTKITATNLWKSEFAYDGKMRRRIRREYTWQNSAWVLTNEVRYIYDGNLVIQERNSWNIPAVTYTRGNDLSGSLERAGGIGGLLARTDSAIVSLNPSAAHACYFADANGNVTALIDGKQQVVATYLYDPFGKLLSMSGPLADANLYRFSSKEAHSLSGLAYFLYRYCDANSQRWVTADPRTEVGFETVRLRPFAHLSHELSNLYRYVDNAPTIAIDPFGLSLVGTGLCVGGCWLDYLGDLATCAGISICSLLGGMAVCTVVCATPVINSQCAACILGNVIASGVVIPVVCGLKAQYTAAKCAINCVKNNPN